ncbi:MAG: diacylglycerol kinase [Gammaproteobacteria bacterium]|nr:diacylglycerol kinase [Gammaproteobacteria bacterium]
MALRQPILVTANKKPKPKKGAKRILTAFTYSLSGLSHAIKNEAAFRQELMLLAPLTIAALLLPFDLPVKVLLVTSHIAILIVELLNSAIEAVVDKASPELHDLAKQAKDMGSAAVLLSFLILSIFWAYAITDTFV